MNHRGLRSKDMDLPEVEDELNDFSVVEESGESSSVGAGSLESFDVQRQVVNSWFHLSNGNSIELPWEQGYWKSFFSNEYQGTDFLSGTFKRPVPVPNVDRCGVVEPEPKRVKPSLKVAESWVDVIKNAEEETWQEHKEAVRQCALKRWCEILKHLPKGLSLVRDLLSFTEVGQQLRFIQDLLANRAPDTMLKRANSFQRLLSLAATEGIAFPPSQLELYKLLCLERDEGAPTSRLQSFMEALRFGQHVLGLRELDDLTTSRICNSVCKKKLTCERKQAAPFRVSELQRLHKILNDWTRDRWDRLMCGMILLATYSRSRWSDLQHGQRLIRDYDHMGQLAFLEVHSFEFKTRNSSAFRGTFLPSIAPSVGVTNENWAEVWMGLRDDMQLDDALDFPPMPAPKADGQPRARPVDTEEMGRWLKLLLGEQQGSQGCPTRQLTSHSCKCSCLSYLSKWGATWEDRAVLGGHCTTSSSVVVYSRDAMARPLLILEQMLQQIRTG